MQFTLDSLHAIKGELHELPKRTSHGKRGMYSLVTPFPFSNPTVFWTTKKGTKNSVSRGRPALEREKNKKIS